MGILVELFPATAFADFAKAPADDVRAAIAELWRKQHADAEVAEEPVLARDLRSALARLDPATTLPRSIVLNTQKAGWVAIYYNAIAGMRLAGFIARRFATDALHFRLMADTIKRQGKTLVGRFGQVRFEYYADGEQQREIANVNDQGKWRFGHNGDPLPFEDLKAYKASRIVDRFTPTMLLRYLAALDLRPFDDDFFRVDARHPAEGVAVKSNAKPRAEVMPRPLSQIRREWGLTDDVIAALLGARTQSPPKRNRPS